MERRAKKNMALGAFLTSGGGHHVASWRHPSWPTAQNFGYDIYVEMAQEVERAKFDLLFLADALAGVDVNLGEGAAYMSLSGQYDPLTLLPALAAKTEHIGLVATVSTTYNEPYHVARKFATLDVISGGRAAWNLVTSSVLAEANNFGCASHLEREKRYEIAEEFVDVVRGLWDSWEDDAFPCDKATGIFSDLSKLHTLNHVGEHFSVRGPLTCERSPQGQSVIVQAGSSDDGMKLAARTAEVIFTAQPTLARAQKFYSSIKGQMAKFNRHPDAIRVMPGFFPVIGGTMAEAERKLEELQELIHPQVALSLLKRTLGGGDIADIEWDKPPPSWLRNQPNSRAQIIMDEAVKNNLTMLEMAKQAAISRGHCIVVGTPDTVADVMEEWFLEGGADGFNIMPPLFMQGLTDFTQNVVPELQRRGLFRTEYEHSTLRGNLGFARPEHPSLHHSVEALGR